jgi:hypothetical protein
MSRSKSHIWKASATVTLALAVACGDRDRELTTVPSRPTLSTRPLATGSALPRQDENLFLEIAQEVPSYAGHFLDDQGRIAAYVVDEADFAVAHGALDRRLATGRIQVPTRRFGHRPAVAILKGQFTLQELSDWRDSATAKVLGLPGVVSTDLDEGHNRVTIGVEAGSGAQALVVTTLTAAGVPTAAIRIETEGKPKLTSGPTSLTAFSSEIAGGLSIGGAGCTIGFTAQYANGTPAFITASHCSTAMMATENTTYGQPANTVPAIAHEVFDPSGGNCPILWTWCSVYRYSDASLNEVTTTSRTFLRGVVARPLQRVDVGTGSPAVDTLKPYLYVVGVQTDILQNQSAEHIGITSGWNYGAVTSTCIDKTITGHMVRCVYQMSAEGNDGDSGGPAFTWDGEDGITALGIVFAREQFPDRTVFAKWSNVNMELTGTGSPTTALNITTPVTMTGNPNLSGTISGGVPSMSWPAVTTTNTTKPTVYKIYRTAWDASTNSWVNNGTLIAETTSTSFTDYSVPLGITTETGSSKPNPCVYTYVAYGIRAYNSGRFSDGEGIYYRGAANGITPDVPQCEY